MTDLVIIGGGSAGMAAAISAYENGVKDILILERDRCLGGILQQCIHSGFGLHKFKQELTGPEYAHKYAQRTRELGIPYLTDTTVTAISPQKEVAFINKQQGKQTIQAGAIILAMGCRERNRGVINIAGTRPAGVYTAGAAQKLVNIDGYLPGHKIVILGSGDIGLIMARRMTLEGAVVRAVCEIMPYSGGLTRNIVQCLNDFDIPLRLGHTVTEVHGTERVCGVTIAQVDANRQPISGTEEYIPCDTLLLSVGLIPENELSRMAEVTLNPKTGGAVVDQWRQTNREGIFACGNVLHVHDLVDFVSDEAEIAGTAAARYLLNRASKSENTVQIVAGEGISYTVPQCINGDEEDAQIYFRFANAAKNVIIVVMDGGNTLMRIKKERALPAEMERVTIKKEMLQGIAGNQIHIGLEAGK